MRTVRPKFAAAPRAKIPTRAAAATGTETGRPAGAVPENKSMMRPIVKGIESDIVEETHSCTTNAVLNTMNTISGCKLPALHARERNPVRS